MASFDVFTRVSVGMPESENVNCFLAKRGVMVPGVSCIDRKNWGQEQHLIRSSCIQRCLSFSKRVCPGIIFLKASQVSTCLKHSCSSWKSRTYWNHFGRDWKRMSCHGNRIFYSRRSLALGVFQWFVLQIGEYSSFYILRSISPI